MASQVTVGIDIGTTSVKAVAADGDGRVVARSQVPHPAGVPAADRLEHDPAVAWQAGPVEALRRLGDPAELGIAAVNVAAMVPSCAAFDGAGRPLTPGLLYGDERGRRLKAAGSDEGEFLSMLAWAAAERPDAAGFWPAQAAANHALGGPPVIDTITAASTTPAWFGSGWNGEALAGVGIDADRLPSARDPGAPVGRALGTGAVLAAGGIDAVCEQLVAGAEATGDVLVVCGTTLLTWTLVDEWVERPGLWTIPSMTAPGGVFVGGASNAGGLFLSWVARLFGPADEDDDGLDPGRVPVWEPYLRGERTPLHQPDRRAALHHLDLTHGAAACRRAAFEAAGFVVRQHVDLAVGAPAAARRIVATGGGVRVAPWVQALADCTGLPVDVVAVPEGGALGSAWLARVAAGLEDGLGDAPRWAGVARQVEPDPRWVAACEERYERFRRRAVVAGAADATGP